MRPYTFVVICFSPRPCIPSESWIQLSQRHCRFLQWHLYQSHGTTQKKKLRNKGLQALTVKYHKVKDEPKENWGRPVDRRTIREPARFLEVVESPIRLGKEGDGNATAFITVQIFQNEAGNLCDEWPTCRQKPKVLSLTSFADHSQVFDWFASLVSPLSLDLSEVVLRSI